MKPFPTTQETVLNHSRAIHKQLKGYANNCSSPLELLDTTLSKFYSIQKQYESSMFELTENFQNSWTSIIKDENYVQYFQLISNCFLWVCSNHKEFIRKFTELYQSPLRDLIDDYKHKSTQNTGKINSLIELINNLQNRLEDKKERYYKKGAEIDKANKTLDELIKKDRYTNYSSNEMDKELHNVAVKYAEIKMKMKQSESMYMNSVDEMNLKWRAFHRELRKYITDFHQVEMNKNTQFEKVTTSMIGEIYKFNNSITVSNKELNAFTKKIEHLRKNFPMNQIYSHELLLLDHQPYIKEHNYTEYISYEEHKRRQEILNSEEFLNKKSEQEKEQVLLSEKEMSQINMLIEMIFENQHDDKIDKDWDFDIFSFFNNETRRKVFIGKTYLRQVSLFKPIKLDEKKFKFLLIIFQYVCLSQSINEEVYGQRRLKKKSEGLRSSESQKTIRKPQTPELKNKIDINFIMDLLNVSAKLFTTQELGTNLYLIENLNKLPIWVEKDIWQNMFKAHQQHYLKVNTPKSSKTEMVMGLFSKKMWFGPSKETELYERSNKYSIDEVGSMLFKLRFPYEYIAETLLTLVEEFSLEIEYVKKILRSSEELLIQEVYEKISIKYKFDLKKKKMDIKSILTKAQVFEKCLEFQDNPKDWIEISQINKKFYTTLKVPISKRILSRKNITDDIRRKIWPDFILPEFKKLQVNPKLTLDNDETFEIINQDVRRTFSADTDFNKDALVRILVNLCVVFKETFSYYQGMNYVVAFQMIMFPKDEHTVLRLSCTLYKTMISKYVNTRLEGLKSGFYCLNRLLQMNQPLLHAKLRSERVNVDVFCSPWFLTCFSLSAQHDKDSQTLRQVWDILLSEKWIGFYKVSLVLLKLNEKDIMNYSYEDIMQSMFDILKSQWFCNTDNSRKKMSQAKNLASSTMLNTSTNSENDNTAMTSRDRSTTKDSTTLSIKSDMLGDSDLLDIKNKYKNFNMKNEANKEKLNERQLESLHAEYIQVAKKIEQFWESYGKQNNKMKSSMSKFNLDI